MSLSHVKTNSIEFFQLLSASLGARVSTTLRGVVDVVGPLILIVRELSGLIEKLITDVCLGKTAELSKTKTAADKLTRFLRNYGALSNTDDEFRKKILDKEN